LHELCEGYILDCVDCGGDYKYCLGSSSVFILRVGNGGAIDTTRQRRREERDGSGIRPRVYSLGTLSNRQYLNPAMILDNSCVDPDLGKNIS